MKIFYLIKEGFKNIWTNRMMSLASVIVLVSCLIITGAAFLISLNVTHLISKIGDDDQITVYLDYDLNDLQSIKLGSQISKIENIESYSFYSKEDALKQYEQVLDRSYGNRSCIGAGSSRSDMQCIYAHKKCRCKHYRLYR